jgi:NADPH:quinone reductase-like Zn-dependent oxidoreductase
VTVARTLWFERPGVAALRREPVPDPGPGEVRVRAICSGVSAGTERLVLLGRVPAAVRARMTLPTMKGSFDLPAAYGYATVGEVEALGPSVPTFRLGDRRSSAPRWWRLRARRRASWSRGTATPPSISRSAGTSTRTASRSGRARSEASTRGAGAAGPWRDAGRSWAS